MTSFSGNSLIATWFMSVFNRTSDGMNDIIIGITNKNNEFVTITEDEFVSQIDSKKRFEEFGGIKQIKNPALSPDGHFALLHVGEGEKSVLLLVDLETKASCVVDGIEETIATPALGPSFEWNGDKIIIYTTEKEHKVYQFDF